MGPDGQLKGLVPRRFQWVTGYETTFFRCDREITEDVHPHPAPPTNLVAADVRRLKLYFTNSRWSLLTSAATVQGFHARILRGILSPGSGRIVRRVLSHANLPEAHLLPGGEGRGEGEREL